MRRGEEAEAFAVGLNSSFIYNLSLPPVDSSRDY